MAEASVAIQVLPSVQGNTEIISIVDQVIAYIKSTNTQVCVSPFETVIEGDFDHLMNVVKQCQLICIEAGAPSVMSYIKINYCPEGGVLSIDEKIQKHR